MTRQWLLAVFIAITSASVPPRCMAEEASEAVLTLTSGTTISGFVSTSAAWQPGSVSGTVYFLHWSQESGGSGHYYGVIDHPFGWQNAENLAQLLGGHLVSINSPSEQSFLESTFLANDSPFNGRPLWTGLNYSTGLGGHVWSSGEALDFVNWADGEGALNAASPHTVLNWSHAQSTANPRGQWSQTSQFGSTGAGGATDGPYYGLMELAVIPEPSVALLLLAGLTALAAGTSSQRRSRDRRSGCQSDPSELR